MVDLSKIGLAKTATQTLAATPPQTASHFNTTGTFRPGRRTAPFTLPVAGHLTSQSTIQTALSPGASQSWQRSTVQQLQQAHELGMVALRSVKAMYGSSETIKFELRGTDRADVLGDLRASGQDDAFRLRLSSTLLPNAHCRTEQTRIHASHVFMLYDVQASISKPDFCWSNDIIRYRDGAAKPTQNHHARSSYQNQPSDPRTTPVARGLAGALEIKRKAEWRPRESSGRIGQLEARHRPMNELVIKANHRNMFLGMAIEANRFCEDPALHYLKLIEKQAEGLTICGEHLPIYVYHGHQNGVRDHFGVFDSNMPTNTFLPLSRSAAHVNAALITLSRNNPSEVTETLLKHVGAERVADQAHTFIVLDDAAYLATLDHQATQRRADMHDSVNQALRYLRTQCPPDFEVSKFIQTHKANVNLNAKGIFNTPAARYPEISEQDLDRYCQVHCPTPEAAQKLKQVAHLTFRLEARQQDFIDGNPVHFENTQHDLNTVAKL